MYRDTYKNKEHIRILTQVFGHRVVQNLGFVHIDPPEFGVRTALIAKSILGNIVICIWIRRSCQYVPRKWAVLTVLSYTSHVGQPASPRTVGVVVRVMVLQRVDYLCERTLSPVAR